MTFRKRATLTATVVVVLFALATDASALPEKYRPKRRMLIAPRANHAPASACFSRPLHHFALHSHPPRRACPTP